MKIASKDLESAFADLPELSGGRRKRRIAIKQEGYKYYRGDPLRRVPNLR